MVNTEEVRASVPDDAAAQHRRPISAELAAKFAVADHRLFALVQAYRLGETRAADGIYEMYARQIGRKVRRMNPQRPLYENEDMRQEIAVEIFAVARSMPLRRPEFLSRDLWLRAVKNVTRRLRREWNYQDELRSLEEFEERREDGEE